MTDLISVFINQKDPEEVDENVLQHLIGSGRGVMDGIFFDNGGEFNSNEVYAVARSLLNVKSTTLYRVFYFSSLRAFEP